jgi:hypothetical protein
MTMTDRRRLELRAIADGLNAVEARAHYGRLLTEALGVRRQTPSPAQKQELRERAEAIAAFAAGGATLEEIGRHFGISRERARQIRDRIAPDYSMTRGWRRVPVIEFLKAIRAPGIASYAAAAEAIGLKAVSPKLMSALDELGLRGAADRLFRMRARRQPSFWWSEDRVIGALRALATRLGRTPGVKDLTGRRDHGVPSPGTVIRFFGSLKRAQLAAGLTPTRQGGEGAGRARKRRLGVTSTALSAAQAQTPHSPERE